MCFQTRPGARQQCLLIVLINNGRIAGISSDGKLAIPAGAQVIDGTGKYLIPGLADMHNHLGSGLPADPPAAGATGLATLLNWGITTIFCPGITMQNYREVRSAVAANPLKYPHFYSAGNAFTAEGGFDPSHGQASLRPNAPGEAREQVRAMKAAGVDAIKMIMDSGTSGGRPAKAMLKPEIYAAIINEAHKLGLKAVVHVPELENCQSCVTGRCGRINPRSVFRSRRRGVPAIDEAEPCVLHIDQRARRGYVGTCGVGYEAIGPG